jgi:hypothetical protein
MLGQHYCNGVTIKRLFYSAGEPARASGNGALVLSSIPV